MARRMKGEGSLYQTKDKTWVCQYYDADPGLILCLVEG